MTISSAKFPLLARRYVTALLDVAAENPGLTALRAELVRLSAMMTDSLDFSSVLSTPLISVNDQQRAVAAVLDRAGFSDALKGFVRVLLKNRRGAFAASFIQAAIEEIDRRAGLSSAQIFVATPLNDLQQKKLADLLSQWSGTRVGLNVTVSPDVIGGLKVRLGSIQIDDSISGKLARLKQVLDAEQAA